MIGLIVDGGSSSGLRPLDDAAGEDPVAERHEHAGADGGCLDFGGQAVGQAVERGHGHRDANETHFNFLTWGSAPHSRLRTRGSVARGPDAPRRSSHGRARHGRRAD